MYWSNEAMTQHDDAGSETLPSLSPPRWPSGKVSASRVEDPGFQSRLSRDFFGVESYL